MIKIRMIQTNEIVLNVENWNFEFVSDFDIRIWDLKG